MATVKKIKKAQRGGCLSTTGASTRIKMYKQAAGEGSSDRMYRKEARQAARAERQEARAERKAAKAAPAAKYGKAVKKAQSGTALTEMGKKTTKAAVKKRTDDMAKSLDKASVLGKNYIAPGDSAKKKAVKKPVPKKKMGGKCKYGC